MKVGDLVRWSAGFDGNRPGDGTASVLGIVVEVNRAGMPRVWWRLKYDGVPARQILQWYEDPGMWHVVSEG